MNKHSYAHQILNQLQITITSLDGKPISKHLNPEERFTDFELTTQYTLHKHISISNKKIIRVDDYDDILHLGFQVSKRNVLNKNFVGQRVEYFLIRKNPEYFDMGMIPPDHVIEYNIEENWLRLVGRNSSGHKVLIYHKRLNPYKKEFRIEDAEEVLEQEAIRLSPFTFEVQEKRKEIPEIPLITTDDGKLVCFPQRRDLPKIGIFGKNGTGKTLFMHMLQDNIYGKWKKRCVIMNDGVSFQTKYWSTPWNPEDFKDFELLKRLEVIGHQTKPSPIIYLFPNTDDLKYVELENESSFRIALPWKDALFQYEHFFQDIEDLGKSGKYFSDLIKDDDGKPRANGIIYSKDIQQIFDIINEKVFVEKEVMDNEGRLTMIRDFIYKIQSDGTRGKLFTLLKEAFNSQMFDVNTNIASRWIVTTPDGDSNAVYPWRACLASDIIPDFVTNNIRDKKFFPAYYKFIQDDLFRMQQEPINKRNEIELWEFIDELHSLLKYPTILENFKMIAKEARPNRMGIVYATQFFGQIPSDIELITDYIISFQQTKDMGTKILENFDGMKTMVKQIRTLQKFNAIVAAKAGESLVIYDTEGNRTVVDDGTPFKGMIFPSVSRHSAPKSEGI